MPASWRHLASAFGAVALSAAAQSGPPSVVRTVPEAAGQAIISDGNSQVFVANSTLNRVTVLERDGVVARSFATGKSPRWISFDGSRVFTSNEGDQTLTISTITGTTNLPIGGAGPMVSTSTRTYVLRQGNNGEVAVVDPSTLSWYAIDTGSHTPFGLAVNSAGTRLFVSHTLSGDVRSIDLTSTSDHPPSVSIQIAGQPGPITYEGQRDKVYVLSDDARGPLVEIDAKTNVATPIVMAGHGLGPRIVKATPTTVFAGFANELVIMDVRSRNLTFVPTAEVRAIAVDTLNGYGFVLDAANVLRVIETATMRMDTLQLPSASLDVAYIGRECNAYVAGAALSVVRTLCGGDRGPPQDISAQALWWVPQESGWGFNIAHQGKETGSILFGTWFTYDAQGQPTWFVMSRGERTGTNRYKGTLYRTSGPAFNAPSFDPSKVTITPAGSAEIRVSSVDNASLSMVVDGVSIEKALSRQQFGAPTPSCGVDVAPGALPNYQDLWWNPNESGWGLNIAHQGDVLFITWFTYDIDGKPLWFVGSDVRKTGNATYAGTLYRTVGPPATASPWDPSKVFRIPAGSATLTFADGDHGTFAYTVNALSGSKAITRQVFSSPPTRCR
jgi:hypothetical protein